MRATVWKTTNIQIAGQNTTNINFAIIQNQIRFIDTTKYFQQSLANLASSMTEIEKQNIRKNFKKISNNELFYCNDEEEEWVLDYLVSGKGVFPYQLITNLESLKQEPKGDFFEKDDFYSGLKEKNISDKDYQDVKKLFRLLRFKTLVI